MNKETEEKYRKLWLKNPNKMKDIKDFIEGIEAAAERRIREETSREIEKLRKRFRCAACDGAKCEHTQGCQILSNILSKDIITSTWTRSDKLK